MTELVSLSGECVPSHQVHSRPLEFQKLLRAAKELGSAVCLCRNDVVLKLVVRQHQFGLALAAWPGTIEMHANSCPFHGARPGEAIGQTDEEDQQLMIHITYRDGWCNSDSYSQKLQSDKLSDVTLDWMLGEIWERTQLSSWRGSWSRDWYSMRRRITETAASMEINFQPLADKLYVIEPYSSKRKVEINTAWEMFTSPLKEAPFSTSNCQIGGAYNTGLVLGELHSAELSSGTWVLRLKNHYEQFGVVPEAVERIGARLASKLQQLTFGAEYCPVALMCVAVDPLGLVHVLDMCLMEVGACWLPASIPVEVALTRALVELKFDFVVTKGHKWGRGKPYIYCKKRNGSEWVSIYSYSDVMTQTKLQQYRSKVRIENEYEGRNTAFVGYADSISKVLALQ